MAPELVVAKKPNNIIYKSIFSTSSWCKMLGMKYLTGIPVNRFNQLFPNIETKLKASTIFGGFEKLLEVMRPLYNEIVKFNQSESHWHADETSWCRMLDNESKERRLHWMWVFVGKKSVVYVLDSTRSKAVPERYFKNTKKGIINVDRYASYNILSSKIILAYCWYHLRRDFISIGKKYKNLEKWAISWLLKIRKIENLNRVRVSKYSQGLCYDDIQKQLVDELNCFFEDAEYSMSNDTLKKEQFKVLKSMISKRDGYTVFVDNPEISMHNNVAERQFRHIANARNNYNGSVSNWGGELAAVTWTIFKSAELNGLSPIEYLLTYFQNYAMANGIPQNLNELLPWNYSSPSYDNVNRSG
jgi:transposase